MTSKDVESIQKRLKAAAKATEAGDTATALGRINEAQRLLREVVDRMSHAAGKPHSDADR